MRILLWLLMIGSILGSALAELPSDAITERSRAKTEREPKDDLDATWLQRVKPLFPEVRDNRSGKQPFFAEVIEVVRVPLEDGQTRVVVWVKVIVPAARVDHGWGEVMIFAQADDEQPLARRNAFTLPIMRASEISLVAGRWLQFGKRGPLVSLADLEALKHFQEQGTPDLMWGLSVLATERALVIYLDEGREAFLKQAPLAPHQEKSVRLPARIRAVHFYHSLAEDMRYAGFKYSDAWEGTILVRLTPADEQSPPVTLEIGTRASSAGIEAEAVEMFLWQTLPTAPTDRPADLIPIPWNGDAKDGR